MSDGVPVMHQERCLPGCLSAHSDAPEEDDGGCVDCRSVYGNDYTRIDDDSATLDGTYDKAQLIHIASHLSGDDPPADYLARLRAVERVLEGGFHDPAKFVARIRGAIGVLP
jgi:hypothetical protein